MKWTHCRVKFVSKHDALETQDDLNRFYRHGFESQMCMHDDAEDKQNHKNGDHYVWLFNKVMVSRIHHLCWWKWSWWHICWWSRGRRQQRLQSGCCCCCCCWWWWWWWWCFTSKRFVNQFTSNLDRQKGLKPILSFHQIYPDKNMVNQSSKCGPHQQKNHPDKLGFRSNNSTIWRQGAWRMPWWKRFRHRRPFRHLRVSECIWDVDHFPTPLNARGDVFCGVAMLFMCVCLFGILIWLCGVFAF